MRMSFSVKIFSLILTEQGQYNPPLLAQWQFFAFLVIKTLI